MKQTLLEDITEELAKDMSYKIDRYIKLHIKPKPKYLPIFVWNWLLKQLLVLEEFKK